jgi:hypothetical protein
MMTHPNSAFQGDNRRERPRQDAENKPSDEPVFLLVLKTEVRQGSMFAKHGIVLLRN